MRNRFQKTDVKLHKSITFPISKYWVDMCVYYPKNELVLSYNIDAFEKDFGKYFFRLLQKDRLENEYIYVYTFLNDVYIIPFFSISKNYNIEFSKNILIEITKDFREKQLKKLLG